MSKCLGKEVCSKFVSLIMKCDSVIVCRANPRQKADMVNLIKQNTKAITLAIGDGGNDVNMIQVSINPLIHL